MTRDHRRKKGTKPVNIIHKQTFNPAKGKEKRVDAIKNSELGKRMFSDEVDTSMTYPAQSMIEERLARLAGLVWDVGDAINTPIGKYDDIETPPDYDLVKKIPEQWDDVYARYGLEGYEKTGSEDDVLLHTNARLLHEAYENNVSPALTMQYLKLIQRFVTPVVTAGRDTRPPPLNEMLDTYYQKTQNEEHEKIKKYIHRLFSTNGLDELLDEDNDLIQNYVLMGDKDADEYVNKVIAVKVAEGAFAKALSGEVEYGSDYIAIEPGKTIEGEPFELPDIGYVYPESESKDTGLADYNEDNFEFPANGEPENLVEVQRQNFKIKRDIGKGDPDKGIATKDKKKTFEIESEKAKTVYHKVLQFQEKMRIHEKKELEKYKTELQDLETEEFVINDTYKISAMLSSNQALTMDEINESIRVIDAETYKWASELIENEIIEVEKESMMSTRQIRSIESLLNLAPRSKRFKKKRNYNFVLPTRRRHVAYLLKNKLDRKKLKKLVMAHREKLIFEEIKKKHKKPDIDEVIANIAVEPDGEIVLEPVAEPEVVLAEKEKPNISNKNKW